jgi:hypothetical protein
MGEEAGRSGEVLERVLRMFKLFAVAIERGNIKCV